MGTALARPGTIARNAVDELRASLIAGRLTPGDTIDLEGVARSLGFSVDHLREGLAVLEREGQVTYQPLRGYFVVALDLGDLREIYELRSVLEARAARRALPLLSADALERIAIAARDCVEAVDGGDIAAELEANRRFHFGFLDSPGQDHTLDLIKRLWDSSEMFRAMDYNALEARRDAVASHDRILAAARRHDATALVAELDDHRSRALVRLERVLAR